MKITSLTILFLLCLSAWAAPPGSSLPANAKRDSGLLYHMTGADQVWPTSVESQVQEGDTGDYFLLGGPKFDTETSADGSTYQAGGQDNTTSASDAAPTDAARKTALAVTASTAPAVTSFTVVDATTGTEIATFTGSGAVSIAATPNINVRANAANAGSVAFVEGAYRSTENWAPFALRGDSNGQYAAWSPAEGTYVISATPYAGSGASGTAGAVATLSLTVTREVAPPDAVYDVTSLVLVNASNGVAIRTLQANDTLNLSDLGAPGISIQALANAGTKSVKFESTAAGVSRVEGTAPWAFLSNSGSGYTPWLPVAGTHTITATGYSGSGASGTAGKPMTVTLNVTPSGATGVAHAYPKTDGPAKNPMKGWNMGTWNDEPDSTVAFTYIDWKTFESNDQDFTSARIENQQAMDWWLNRPGTNNRHVILRVLCQWDGGETKIEQLSCPSFVMQKVGLLTGQNALGQWGGTSVDFNDPDFIAQAAEMIAALGAKYNNDPKIYAIQLGLIGYWGEWHAYQFKTSSGAQGYPIATETKSRILAAYKKAFPNKLLMGRYLNDSVLGNDTKIGYHNDYFWPSHGHNNDFEFSVGEKWKQGPIGGETPPDPKGNEFYNNGIGLQSIRNAHYSTMQPGGFYRGPFDPTKHTEQYRLEREEYVKAHKLMGYNFQIEQALFPTSVLNGTAALPVAVEINNIGVAPFYYDWDIELALLDQSTNAPVQSVKSTQKLTSFAPNQKSTISVNVPIGSTLKGTYRVAIRIAQPDASATKTAPWRLDARNTYIQFANQMTVVDASWNASNALQGGWSILGNVTIP